MFIFFQLNIFFYFFIYYFYLELLTKHSFFYMKIIYILLDIKCVRLFCTGKQEIKINPLACLLCILSIHVNQSYASYMFHSYSFFFLSR